MTIEKLVKTIIPTLGIVLTTSLTANAQSHNDDVDEDTLIVAPDPAGRAAVLGINMGINGLVCGIAAAVEERNILQDAGKCMAGGAIQYAGMEMAMHDAPVLPGVGLRVVETGTSIVENTLAGREPFEYLHYSLAPVFPGLLQIDTKNQELDFYWNIMPWVGLTYNAAAGNDFDILQSLSYQIYVFDSKKDDFGRVGATFGNIMNYDHDKPHNIAAHEFAHVLQYTRMRPAQQLIPQQVDFVEKILHLRLGEDLAAYSFWAAKDIGCIARDWEPLCERRWWNLLEAEAYTMETGNEQYKPETLRRKK